MIDFKNAIRNITILRDFFEEHITQSNIDLDMSYYAKKDGQTSNAFGPYYVYKGMTINSCGYSCCLVGFAAVSKIDELEPEVAENWYDYINRLFVNQRAAPDVDEYFFGPDHGNDKDSTIKRVSRGIRAMRIIANYDGTDFSKWVLFNMWCKQELENCDYGSD